MGVGGRDTGKWPGGGPGLLLLALLAGAAGIGPAQAVCTDCDADGVTFPADCNDADPAIHPGAAEVCDGLDDDCNGLVDDSLFCTGTCVNLAKAGFDLLVSGDAAKSVQPSVAWTGNEYGVAWRDERDLNMEIYFALVSAAGIKLTGDLRITNDAASSFAPALVWTGTEFGVAWVDNRNGNKEIYFNRLDAAGLTAGADVRLTADAGTSIQPSLVWTGAEYGVAWTDDRNGNREITFNRLDETGAVLGSDVRVTNDAAVSEQPALVWNGAGYGLVWTDERDGNREIYFNLLGSTGTTAGADIRVTADAAVSAQPSLVWSGSAYGVAWVDERDGNREIYFAGLDAAGAKQAPETRLTVDLAVSEQPSLDWTGQEYGVAWRDTRAINGEIFLARVDPSGSQQGATLRISNDLGLVSRAPDLVWSGTRHAVVWQDIEVNLSRVDCSCEDADMDGISACKDCNDQFAACTTTCTDVDVDGWPICAGDCDDTNAAIFPAAPQVCDGLNNDCNDPAWPALTGTNEADADGDAFSACTGDCDDTNAAIFPAAPQVCDGLNNDCNDPAWPSVVGTGDADADGDGVLVCDGDCDDVNGTVWATPGEARQVRLSFDPVAGVTTLIWQVPATPGGLTLVYDTLRSKNATDFVQGAQCVEGNGTDLISLDSGGILQPGDLFYYLVRGENACPVGEGDLGSPTTGPPRAGKSCQ